MSKASDRDAIGSGTLNRVDLFRTVNGKVQWCEDEPLPREDDLQKVIEDNLQELTGIDFLDSQLWTGSSHRGRIDTLGLDEYGRPVVIEYKRHRDENVINQGLDYLHWLEGEQARARVRALAREKLDVQDVDFDGAWLLCVAWQFPRRDVVAAHYSQRFVALMKYGHFGEGLMSLEVIYPDADEGEDSSSEPEGTQDKKALASALLTGDDANTSLDEGLPDFSETSGWRSASRELRALFMELHGHVLTLLSDVQILPGSQRIAYKGNFFIVVVYVRSRSNELRVLVAVDPASVPLKPGFTRDTGGWPLSHNRLEITIRNREALEQAKPYIKQAVENDSRGEPFDWSNMTRTGRQ